MMGMYDDVKMIGKMYLWTKCAAGHYIDSMQTKSLDSRMTTYYVFEGKAYTTTDDTFDYGQIERGNFVHTSKIVCREAPEVDGTVELHTYCTTCNPVFYESGSSWMGDVDSKSPWCQWEAIFNKGTLLSIVPIRLETREDVQKKLIEMARSPLPDGDRIVQKELARHLTKTKPLQQPTGLPTFEEAWAEKEKEGYQYGDDALELVRFGWEIRDQYR